MFMGLWEIIYVKCQTHDNSEIKIISLTSFSWPFVLKKKNDQLHVTNMKYLN